MTAKEETRRPEGYRYLITFEDGKTIWAKTVQQVAELMRTDFKYEKNWTATQPLEDK